MRTIAIIAAGICILIFSGNAIAGGGYHHHDNYNRDRQIENPAYNENIVSQCGHQHNYRHNRHYNPYYRYWPYYRGWHHRWHPKVYYGYPVYVY
jgi:hypothetical protein